MITITLAIIILTVIISLTANSNQKVIDDLIFYPPAITQRQQWYRFLSCALIHADLIHLAFNMWAFYSFGRALEVYYKQLFGSKGSLLFLATYIIAQVVCLLPTYFKHKNDYQYRSLGASGAVSAIVFATIFLIPQQEIGILFIPFGIPGFIFAFIYLGITMYMSKRGQDNINHSAHFWGALAGVVLLIVFCYAFSTFNPIQNFAFQVRNYIGF